MQLSVTRWQCPVCIRSGNPGSCLACPGVTAKGQERVNEAVPPCCWRCIDGGWALWLLVQLAGLCASPMRWYLHSAASIQTVELRDLVSPFCIPCPHSHSLAVSPAVVGCGCVCIDTYPAPTRQLTTSLHGTPESSQHDDWMDGLAKCVGALPSPPSLRGRGTDNSLPSGHRRRLHPLPFPTGSPLRSGLKRIRTHAGGLVRLRKACHWLWLWFASLKPARASGELR